MGIRLGRSYLKIEHEFVVTVGPADLRFEIRFAGGVVNKEKAIPVQWMYAPDNVGGKERPAGGDEGGGEGDDEVDWQRGLVLYE